MVQLITVPRYWNHATDTFRELLSLWVELGLCRIEKQDTPWVWWGHPNQILLHNPPIIIPGKEFPGQGVLFANEIPEPRCIKYSPWIFWGRHPKELHNLYMCGEYKDYHERCYETIFIGNVENGVQRRFRNPEVWSQVIEFFDLKEGTIYKYSQTEYLKLLSNAKFGLSLRGYGPKCNREIELMALGTVPIVTPEVDMQNYYDPPILGEHYFQVNTPEEIPEIIAQCSPKQWQKMSLNCRDWYWRNCSPEQSFHQTEKICQLFLQDSD